MNRLSQFFYCNIVLILTLINCVLRIPVMLQVGWLHLISLIQCTVKWYILTIFEMLFWNVRDKSKTRWSVYFYTIRNDLLLQWKPPKKNKHAFWHYLKQFGRSETILKTRSLKHAFWYYLEGFGTSWTLFKTRSLKLAFWHFLNDIWNFNKKNNT